MFRASLYPKHPKTPNYIYGRKIEIIAGKQKRHYCVALWRRESVYLSNSRKTEPYSHTYIYLECNRRRKKQKNGSAETHMNHNRKHLTGPLGIYHQTWASIWLIAFLTSVAIRFVQPKIISPFSGAPQIKVYAEDSTENVVGYIYQVFSKSGHKVAMKAIDCAKGESGLNVWATNTNTDKFKSIDRGVFQINSHWHPEFKDYFNYKKNIDYAYKIYLDRKGFDAWYSPDCR